MQVSCKIKQKVSVVANKEELATYKPTSSPMRASNLLLFTEKSTISSTRNTLRESCDLLFVKSAIFGSKFKRNYPRGTYAMTSTTRLCRKILRELRKSNDRVCSYFGLSCYIYSIYFLLAQNVVDHIWQYVASEVRRHSLCTGTNVLHQQQRLLNTYLSYIHSSRIHRVSLCDVSCLSVIPTIQIDI